MAREGGKERMARIAGLDEHLAGTLPAPGASGDPSKHRKQPLGRPVVGRNERRIRVQHGDQRERREVMSLCEELRTDQNVSFAPPDVFQRAHKIGSTPCAVAVDAHDPGAGKKRGQCLFYALRAASHRLQIHVAAGRTVARNRRLGAAMVAAQATVGGVQNHASGAALAPGCPAAGFAGEHRRIATAINENEALLASFQARRDR